MIWLEGVVVALLLVVLPLTAHRQFVGLDPAQLPRLQAYVHSMLTIGLVGLVGFGLGVARWGREGLGLGFGPTPGLVFLRALMILALGMAVVLLFEFWIARRSEPRSPWVLALMPRTSRERTAFGLLSVFAGVGEEIAFRGFALLLVAAWTQSLWVAVLWTSLAFGWIHGYQGGVGRLRATLLGAVLALPVVLSWGLWPSILAHTWIDWIGGFILGPRLVASSSVD